jgi:hypothetical protein
VTNPKGTQWETTVVNYLRRFAPHVERRAKNGAKDRGDVAGIPGVVIECKNARAMDLAGWVDEALTERLNDGAAVAVVWHKRRGKGQAADGYVTMPGWQFVALLIDAGYMTRPAEPSDV